eukprot:1702300-Rhodomonas_salina.3
MLFGGLQPTYQPCQSGPQTQLIPSLTNHVWMLNLQGFSWARLHAQPGIRPHFPRVDLLRGTARGVWSNVVVRKRARRYLVRKREDLCNAQSLSGTEAQVVVVPCSGYLVLKKQGTGAPCSRDLVLKSRNVCTRRAVSSSACDGVGGDGVGDARHRSAHGGLRRVHHGLQGLWL